MLDVVGVGTNSVDEVLQLPIAVSAVMPGGKVRVSDRREAGLSCGIQSHGPLGMLKGALEARGDHHSS